MAIAILTALLGIEMAKKVYMLIKILGINIEGWEQRDFEKLLKEDKRFYKYIR